MNIKLSNKFHNNHKRFTMLSDATSVATNDAEKKQAGATATSESKKSIKARLQTILKKKDDKRPSSGASDERNDGEETSEIARGEEDGSIVPVKSTTTRQDSDNNLVRVSDNPSGRSGSLFRMGDKRQKKVVFTKFSESPQEAIQIQMGDIPEPASENHVVIKVTASTVSLFDCLIRKGVSYEMVDFPITPGLDVVGNIIKCGAKVTQFRVGDRVAALVRFGGNARYVCVYAMNLVEVPRSCDAAEAVCVVSTYMTAYQSLRMVTNADFTLDGKRVLIAGGVEPIGQALIQLCRRAGATEIYATAPAMRHKYVENVLGVHPLSPSPEDWTPIVKGRMNIIFDGTCQAPYMALASDGVMVSLGESTLMKQETPGIFGAPISAYLARFKGVVMPNTKVYDLWDSFIEDKNAFKMDLEVLLHLLKKRFIKPHIAKRISLEEVVESHASLEKESSRGEIVCFPWKRCTTMGKAATDSMSDSNDRV